MGKSFGQLFSRLVRGFFSRKSLVRLGISVGVSVVPGLAVDIVFDAHLRGDLAYLQGEAYRSVSKFAPWNVAERYATAVFASDAPSQFERAQQNLHSLACTPPLGNPNNPQCAAQANAASQFYLSAHVPWMLRPITGFFDLFAHLYIDAGIFGFLFAAVQTFLGYKLLRLVADKMDWKLNSFAGWFAGIPLGTIAFGSIAVLPLPLWLVALIGVMALPAGGLGAQVGATAYMVSWVVGKAAEEVGHDAVMKQVERLAGD